MMYVVPFKDEVKEKIKILKELKILAKKNDPQEATVLHILSAQATSRVQLDIMLHDLVKGSISLTQWINNHIK